MRFTTACIVLVSVLAAVVTALPASDYVTYYEYDSTDCSGNPIHEEEYQVGVCVPITTPVGTLYVTAAPKDASNYAIKGCTDSGCTACEEKDYAVDTCIRKGDEKSRKYIVGDSGSGVPNGTAGNSTAAPGTSLVYTRYQSGSTDCSADTDYSITVPIGNCSAVSVPVIGTVYAEVLYLQSNQYLVKKCIDSNCTACDLDYVTEGICQTEDDHAYEYVISNATIDASSTGYAPNTPNIPNIPNIPGLPFGDVPGLPNVSDIKA